MTVREPIAVIGAGVVGVMTARALAAKGHAVALIDANPGPAELCSRANAGIIAVGHARAWAGPEALPAMGRALIGQNPALRLTNVLDPGLWPWGLAFLGQCTAAAHRRNSDRLHRLATFSRGLVREAEAAMGLPAETRHRGGLYLFQDARQFAAACANPDDHPGLVALDRSAVLAREPGLAGMADTLAGGLYSDQDAVGDCRLFTTRTADWLGRLNHVALHYGTRVTGVREAGARVVAVETDQGEISCAGLVLAAGIATPGLAKRFGVRPHIYPIKGYSGTWRVTDPSGVPDLPFVDETEFVAGASYSGILRVTATAEFAGRDTSLPEARLRHLKGYVARCFGAAVDLESATFWCGHRPTTPGSAPYLGRVTSRENLWINAGHGTLGWTLSFGCAEVLARRIGGEPDPLPGVSYPAKWLE